MDASFTPDTDAVVLDTTPSYIVVEVVPMPISPSGYGEIATEITCETQEDAVEAAANAFGENGFWLIYRQNPVQLSPAVVRAMEVRRRESARQPTAGVTDRPRSPRPALPAPTA